ncbi:MAG TPA: alpha/beta hydrolase, partial [Rugosimonospora sp.]|nr:alpha/beta hydrolase [Rugosimonospora sp.]
TPAPPPYPEVARYLAEPTHPPAPGTAPSTVARFFADEPATTDEDLTRRYPRIVGALDGAPPALRYAANAPAGARTLLYDPRGDGRIATVAGDLATADRVTVLVPGVDTTLANFARGLGGVTRRSPAWQATQLLAAARSAAPDARVAVVAWLGYDPPEGIDRAALREDRAATGAVALQRFVAGLVASRPGVRIVLVGHSYGSVVVGLAAPHLDPAVTDIVALGSPGMGGAHTVADLHTTARVWAGTAGGDWTRHIPGTRVLGVGHGRLPFEPGFGALPLPVARVPDHDGYFVPGTDSLSALAAIAVGDAPPVALARPAPLSVPAGSGEGGR